MTVVPKQTVDRDQPAVRSADHGYFGPVIDIITGSAAYVEP
jgi:hypothetical protein